jgi:hypothetical protein
MYTRRSGNGERDATNLGYSQHTLTNTGMLTVSLDRDKGGNGIPRKVKKYGRKMTKQKKTKNLTQGGGKKEHRRC